MKKIRIGKDINVLWTVDVEGLKEMDLSLEMRDSRGNKQDVDTFTLVKSREDVVDEEGKVTDEAPFDTISFGLKAEAIKLLGNYSFILWKNKEKDGQSVLDATNAFTIVGSTDSECGTGILDNPTVKLYSGSICKK